MAVDAEFPYRIPIFDRGTIAAPLFANPFPLLTHQNCTITIASDFRVDGAKSPEIPQKEGVMGSEIAA